MGILSSVEDMEEQAQLAEEQTKLAGEQAPCYHGTLTSQLHKFLESADASRETFGDLERSLKEVFGDNLTIKLSAAARHQPVFANHLARASELMTRLDQRDEHAIIDGLKQVIERREKQQDNWPEARLNLGIAYACLGEYGEARRWLEEATRMIEYPSYIPASQQKAA